MNSGNSYRFVKTEVESLSMLKGEDSWYRISDAEEAPRLYCHVIGNCLGGTSTFHASREDAEVLFRLEPRRKLLNLTYFVSEGESGPQLATLELFATRGMKVSDPDGREMFRVVDPQSKLDKLMQDLLEGCCSEYAIVDDGRVVGAFERRPRPRQAREGHQGRVRKLLLGALGVLFRDWCVELEGSAGFLADHRPLLAALILLQEQSIRLDQSQ